MLCEVCQNEHIVFMYSENRAFVRVANPRIELSNMTPERMKNSNLLINMGVERNTSELNTLNSQFVIPHHIFAKKVRMTCDSKSALHYHWRIQGGAAGAPPPPNRINFFHFCICFSGKVYTSEVGTPPQRVGAPPPPTGNPGSTTDYTYLACLYPLAFIYAFYVY